MGVLSYAWRLSILNRSPGELNYTWSCEADQEGACDQANAVLTAPDVGAVVRFPPRALNTTLYVFSLTITKGRTGFTCALPPHLTVFVQTRAA